MSSDPISSSLFDGLGEAERLNIALLLEKLDGRFTHQISLLREQIKGKMAKQEAGSASRETRLQKLEHCPCAVHRDPSHTCVVLDINEKLVNIEAKIDAKISPIKLRLAYIMGGLGLLAFLLELISRLLPLIWR